MRTFTSPAPRDDAPVLLRLHRAQPYPAHLVEEQAPAVLLGQGRGPQARLRLGEELRAQLLTLGLRPFRRFLPPQPALEEHVLLRQSARVGVDHLELQQRDRLLRAPQRRLHGVIDRAVVRDGDEGVVVVQVHPAMMIDRSDIQGGKQRIP
nr:hypothetical protein GCM10020093_119310 [Planobispora longispora]